MQWNLCLQTFKSIFAWTWDNQFADARFCCDVINICRFHWSAIFLSSIRFMDYAIRKTATLLKFCIKFRDFHALFSCYQFLFLCFKISKFQMSHNKIDHAFKWQYMHVNYHGIFLCRVIVSHRDGLVKLRNCT